MSAVPELSARKLAAIGQRLRAGCPTKGVSVSPWAQQLQADAQALYDEVRRLQAISAKEAA